MSLFLPLVLRRVDPSSSSSTFDSPRSTSSSSFSGITGSTDTPIWKPFLTQVRPASTRIESTNASRLFPSSPASENLTSLLVCPFRFAPDEFFVPEALAETLRRMFELNPKERWSSEQIINTLSTLDLAARGNPQLGGKGEHHPLETQISPVRRLIPNRRADPLALPCFDLQISQVE